MAYIEAHQSLRDHRKILALAAELDMEEAHVAGHCLFLWLWSLDNAEDGILPDSARMIERAAGWHGATGVLVNAMVKSGMLDQLDDGHIVIHNWWDYAGKLIEKRKSDTERKRAERARNGHPAPTSKPVRRTSDGHPTDGAGNVTYPILAKTTVPEDTSSSLDSGYPTFVGAAAADADAQSGDVLSDAFPDAFPDAESLTVRTRRDSEPLPADGEAMRLATLLRDRIRAHTPDARVPATPAKLQPWAKVFDLMLRLDRRAPPDIEAVIAYATTDGFWRANILSPGKLREKYDPLNIKRRQERQQAAQNGHRPVTAATMSRPILTADDVYPD